MRPDTTPPRFSPAQRAFLILVAVLVMGVVGLRWARVRDHATGRPAEPASAGSAGIPGPTTHGPRPSGSPSRPSASQANASPIAADRGSEPLAPEILPLEPVLLENPGLGPAPALAADRIERYLASTGRSASALLAAHALTRNPAFLREAAERFPDSARVQFAVLQHDLFPGNRRAWIDRWRASAPQNALPSYLSALDHLKAGNEAAAWSDLQEATQRKRLADYFVAASLDLATLLADSGSGLTAARAHALRHVPVQHLEQLRQLGDQLASWSTRAAADQDPERARTLASALLQLARGLQSGEGGRLLAAQSVGYAIETRFLEGLGDGPVPADLDFEGTPAERRKEIDARRRELVEWSRSAPAWLSRADDPQLTGYLDRLQVKGESDAIPWLGGQLSGN